MTLQEMFNKAAKGLRAQKFQRSMHPVKALCCYDNGQGMKCAWGHVDPSLKDETDAVRDLRDQGIGVAASLTDDQVAFAQRLQYAHDDGDNPFRMYVQLKDVATRFNLSDTELGPQP